MNIHYSTDFLTGDIRPVGIYGSGASVSYVENAPRMVEGVQSAGAAGGSFWWDGNHIAPGRGWLHLLMVMWAEGQTDGLNRPGVIPKGDLRGGKVTMRLRTHNVNGNPGFYLAKKTRLAFWMQSFVRTAADGEGRFVNLVQVRDLICEQMGTQRPMTRGGNDTWIVSPEWTDVTIPLDPNPDAWICLGARPDKAVSYACAPVGQVLSDFNHNMGVIAFIGEPHLTTPPAWTYQNGWGGSELWIDKFTIERAPT
jgi:hypothetical protein